MDFKPGGTFSAKGNYAKVGDYSCINAYFVYIAEKFSELWIFCIAGHNVYGYVNLNSSFVCVGNGFFKLLVAEIARGSSHSEGSAGKINCVGAEIYGAF